MLGGGILNYSDKWFACNIYTSAILQLLMARVPLENMNKFVFHFLSDEMTEIIEEERKIIFQHSTGADSSFSTIYKAEFGEYGFEGFKFIQKIPH